MKTKGLFVVTSVYHILLSILHIEERKLKPGILVIVEITPNIESLIKGLKQTRWFTDVILMPGRKKQKRMAGKITYTLNRKKIVSLIDAEDDQMLNLLRDDSEYDIYICSPDSAKNYFIYKYKDHSIFMIEDGLKTYVTTAPTTTKQLSNKLVNRPIPNGFDKRITKVFASKPDDLPKELKLKSERLNWKATLAQLSSDKQEELTQAFFHDSTLKDISVFPKDKTKSLIITQTLNEDGIVADESTKLKYYDDFVNQAQTELIYIKPHPRELTDYAEHYKSDERVIVLPQLFPAELLTLLPSLKFEKAFTAYSTAIDALTNVKEKIVLGHALFKR